MIYLRDIEVKTPQCDVYPYPYNIKDWIFEIVFGEVNLCWARRPAAAARTREPLGCKICVMLVAVVAAVV